MNPFSCSGVNDEEIYYIDDLELISILDAKVKSMQGKSDDEIGRALLTNC